MTSLEGGLSKARNARDVHAAFASALGFPQGYSHNWSAFWDSISSDHPLPDDLTIRGLDHVERVLPREAEKMLSCFGDYNNGSGRVCRVAVSDDYDTRMFFLSFEAQPAPGAHRDVRGACISCWIKADSERDAKRIALSTIKADGWHVTSQDEVRPISPRELPDEDDDAFVRQACIDGAVFAVHTWSTDD